MRGTYLAHLMSDRLGRSLLPPMRSVEQMEAMAAGLKGSNKPKKPKSRPIRDAIAAEVEKAAAIVAKNQKALK